jgi:hypothetical protein
MTPSPILSILLTPAANDRYGLVRGGLGGARPPLAQRRVTSEGAVYELLASGDPLETWRTLVLAWNGAPVEPGLDHAARCLAIREDLPSPNRPGGLVESSNGDCFILWPLGKGCVYYGKNRIPVGCAHDTLVIPWAEQHPPQALRYALNLANVCAARLGGTVTLIRAPFALPTSGSDPDPTRPVS